MGGSYTGSAMRSEACTRYMYMQGSNGVTVKFAKLHVGGK